MVPPRPWDSNPSSPSKDQGAEAIISPNQPRESQVLEGSKTALRSPARHDESTLEPPIGPDDTSSQLDPAGPSVMGLGALKEAASASDLGAQVSGEQPVRNDVHKGNVWQEDDTRSSLPALASSSSSRAVTTPGSDSRLSTPGQPKESGFHSSISGQLDGSGLSSKDRNPTLQLPEASAHWGQPNQDDSADSPSRLDEQSKSGLESPSRKPEGSPTTDSTSRLGGAERIPETLLGSGLAGSSKIGSTVAEPGFDLQDTEAPMQFTKSHSTVLDAASSSVSPSTRLTGSATTTSPEDEHQLRTNPLDQSTGSRNGLEESKRSVGVHRLPEPSQSTQLSPDVAQLAGSIVASPGVASDSRSRDAVFRSASGSATSDRDHRPDFTTSAHGFGGDRSSFAQTRTADLSGLLDNLPDDGTDESGEDGPPLARNVRFQDSRRSGSLPGDQLGSSSRGIQHPDMRRLGASGKMAKSVRLNTDRSRTAGLDHGTDPGASTVDRHYTPPPPNNDSRDMSPGYDSNSSSLKSPDMLFGSGIPRVNQARQEETLRSLFTTGLTALPRTDSPAYYDSDSGSSLGDSQASHPNERSGLIGSRTVGYNTSATSHIGMESDELLVSSRGPALRQGRTGFISDAPDAARMSFEWRWANELSLDRFLAGLYDYYAGRGIWSISLARFLGLFTAAFLIGFTSWLGFCIDYSRIPVSKSLSEVMVDQCFRHIPGWMHVGLWTAGVVWFYCAFGYLGDLRRLWIMHGYFRYLFDIPDSDIQTVPWEKVVDRLAELRRDRKSVATEVGPELARFLDMLPEECRDSGDFANRLMRRENYMIGLVHEDVLDLGLHVPLMGRWDIMTPSIEWLVSWLIFDFAFDDLGKVRPGLMDPRQHKKMRAQLHRRLRVAGYAAVPLAPFAAVGYLLAYVFRYFVEFRSNPSELSRRAYSRLASWKFREYNELPHQLVMRENRSRPFADAYLAQFPKDKYSQLCRFIEFVSGALATVLVLASLLDPDLFLGFEITPSRTVLFYLGILTAVYATVRSSAGAGDVAFAPEYPLTRALEHLGFHPPSWDGQLHADFVRRQFSSMYQLRILLFLEDIALVMISQCLLIWKLPRSADKVVDFFYENTVDVPGLGYVSIFAIDEDKAARPYKRAIQASQAGEPEHSEVMADDLADGEVAPLRIIKAAKPGDGKTVKTDRRQGVERPLPSAAGRPDYRAGDVFANLPLEQRMRIYSTDPSGFGGAGLLPDEGDIRDGRMTGKAPSAGPSDRRRRPGSVDTPRLTSQFSTLTESMLAEIAMGRHGHHVRGRDSRLAVGEEHDDLVTDSERELDDADRLSGQADDEDAVLEGARKDRPIAQASNVAHRRVTRPIIPDPDLQAEETDEPDEDRPVTLVSLVFGLFGILAEIAGLMTELVVRSVRPGVRS